MGYTLLQICSCKARSHRKGRASILDFQVIITLVSSQLHAAGFSVWYALFDISKLFYTDTYGLPAMSELVGEGVKVALELRLNHEQTIKALPIPDYERCLIQEAFWYVYALGRRLAVRTGRAYMLSIISSIILLVQPRPSEHGPRGSSKH